MRNSLRSFKAWIGPAPGSVRGGPLNDEERLRVSVLALIVGGLSHGLQIAATHIGLVIEDPTRAFVTAIELALLAAFLDWARRKWLHGSKDAHDCSSHGS